MNIPIALNGISAVVFDWGDTLMKVFPQYTGAMAHWQEVEAVEGAQETLQSLKNRVPLYLATNATDSDTALITQALRRVGLDHFFEAIFTPVQIGVGKQDPRFYTGIASALTLPPQSLIMVGDSFKLDVCNAHQAGWRTAWYTPTHQAAPGLLPLQDLQVDDLRLLPDLLSHRFLPGYPTTLTWLIQQDTPFNILAHIQLVAGLAYQLAVWLWAVGVDLDPIQVQRGAMLHDLAKMQSIRQKQERGQLIDHAHLAYEFLLAQGQPELAQIADRHMPVHSADDPRAPITWEQKLVHFADKLAEGNELVTLEERIVALRARYPEFQADLLASQPFLMALQSEICERLGVTPLELMNRLRAATTRKKTVIAPPAG